MRYIVYMHGIIVQLIAAKLPILRSNSIQKVNWLGNAPFFPYEILICQLLLADSCSEHSLRQNTSIE